MIGSNHSNGDGALFLKLLGIGGLLFSWLLVFRPEMKVYWGRGANRPLVSAQGRLAFALAATGWCLGVFGANQWLAVGLFMSGFVAAVASAKQDEDNHVARTGAHLRKPAKPEDLWKGLCATDAVFLSITSYAAIRDHFHPPVSQEQKSIHVIGVVLLIVSSLGAIGLHCIRPHNTSAE